MHICRLKALIPPHAQAISYAGTKEPKLLLMRIILTNEDNK